MQYINAPFSNPFIDTMRLSRRLHPEEPHHRLSDLAHRYGLEYNGAHRAEHDCYITLAAYQNLKEETLQKYDSLENFVLSCRHHGTKASDIHSNISDFDTSHPLFNKVCVFTGVLERMSRKEAMQLVADSGGINGDTVTQKTNYLVLGNNDYCKSIKDGKSNKQKKAEKLKASGLDIEIIPESVFYDMVLDSD